MPLKGELADLSLAELIEFFCNQRKTGRLTVSYPHAPAYFYLQSGSVVHAAIGSLRGIDAVYYALTQSNASFDFSAAYEAPCQTINQPWTSVVLEGLRRMDEGIKPRNPFPEKIEAVIQKASVKAPEATIAATPVVAVPSALVAPSSIVAPPALVTSVAEQTPVVQSRIENAQTPIAPPPVLLASKTAAPVVEPPMEIKARSNKPEPPVTQALSNETRDQINAKEAEQTLPRPVAPQMSDAFLSPAHHHSKFSHRPWKVAAIFAALILVIAAIAVPWGWRVRGKAAKAAEQPPTAAGESSAQIPQSDDGNSASQPESVTGAETESPADATASSPNADAADTARREREARAREERLRAKAAETSAETSVTQAPPPQPASTTSAPPAVSSGPKKVVVQVTYDENGRVTQATGNDPTALRIARQKRFPPGKAGSATITIPIN